MPACLFRLALCSLLLVTSACAPPPAAPTATMTPPTVISPTAQPPTASPPTARPATAAPPTPTPINILPQVIVDLDSWLGAISQDGTFSGAVLVAHQGEVLLSQGYGLADRQQYRPNTPQTRFRIGSLTKQFTAMAILLLQARGQLKVQDSICDYVADCPSTWEAITLHHLLTHTSGIPNFTKLSDYRKLRATPSAPEETITRFKELPLDFPPGLGWSYSNSGYVLLGAVIEQASGQSYAAFLQESIFDVLNLTNTGYQPGTAELAVGYNDKFTKLPADFIDMSIPYAAGALYSTVEDLYQWDQALYTGQLLPLEEVEPMLSPQVMVPHHDTVWAAYGYGWFVGLERGRLIQLHTGGIEGFAALLARYPEEQVTLIVLSNQANQDVVQIQEILSRKIFGDG